MRDFLGLAFYIGVNRLNQIFYIIVTFLQKSYTTYSKKILSKMIVNVKLYHHFHRNKKMYGGI